MTEAGWGWRGDGHTPLGPRRGPPLRPTQMWQLAFDRGAKPVTAGDAAPPAKGTGATGRPQTGRKTRLDLSLTPDRNLTRKGSQVTCKMGNNKTFRKK